MTGVRCNVYELAQGAAYLPSCHVDVRVVRAPEPAIVLTSGRYLWTVPVDSTVTATWSAQVERHQLLSATEPSPERMGWIDFRPPPRPREPDGGRLTVSVEPDDAAERWRAVIPATPSLTPVYAAPSPSRWWRAPAPVIARLLERALPAWQAGDGPSVIEIGLSPSSVRVLAGSMPAITDAVDDHAEAEGPARIHLLGSFATGVAPLLKSLAALGEAYVDFGQTAEHTIISCGPLRQWWPRSDEELPPLRDHLASLERRSLCRVHAPDVARAIRTARECAPGMDVMLSYLTGELGILTVESYVWGQYETQLRVTPTSDQGLESMVVCEPDAALASFLAMGDGEALISIAANAFLPHDVWVVEGAGAVSTFARKR